MEAHVRQFKECLEAAASSLHLPYSALMRARGVNDFFVDAATKEWSPQELAAHALDQLCEGTKDKLDFAVCLAALRFLKKSSRSSISAAEDERCLRDLVALVQSGGGESRYCEWAKAWFS